MNSKINKVNLTGWLVFLITLTVYFFSVERTGSLWDCGEFVLGAYKLQVVHPPGAPFSNNRQDVYLGSGCIIG